MQSCQQSVSFKAKLQIGIGHVRCCRAFVCKNLLPLCRWGSNEQQQAGHDLKPVQQNAETAGCQDSPAAFFKMSACIHYDTIWVFWFYLSICLSIYLSIYLSIHPSIHLSIYPAIQLSSFPAIHLSPYPSIWTKCMVWLWTRKLTFTFIRPHEIEESTRDNGERNLSTKPTLASDRILKTHGFLHLAFQPTSHIIEDAHGCTVDFMPRMCPLSLKASFGLENETLEPKSHADRPNMPSTSSKWRRSQIGPAATRSWVGSG